MRFWYICLVWLLLCATARTARGQYVFTSLYPKDGLSSKEVYCSYTDSDGFLWCGTENGLNRWDGSHFYVINPFSKTYPGLPNEIVTTITEWDGRLWAGTAKGLAWLNKNDGRFHVIPFLRGTDTLQEVAVERLMASSDGHFWAGTQQGLFVYAKGCMLPVSTVLPAAGMLDKRLTFVHPAGGNAVWARADTSIYYLDVTKGICYSKAYNPLGWDIFNHNYFWGVSVDNDGLVWYSTFHGRRGLFSFNPATGKSTETKGFEKQDIILLYNDRHNRLWISTIAPVAYVLEHATGRLTRLGNEEGSLSYARVLHMHEDAAGNIWFATVSGLSKLPAVQSVQSYIPLPMSHNKVGTQYSLINTLQVADSGHIWVCKDDGLYRMSLADRGFKRYAPLNKMDAREDRIFEMQYIRGQWWCGTGTGIQFFNPASGRFTPFTAYPEDRKPWKRSVMWIQPDAEGTIWYASWVDGVCRYNPATGKSVHMADSSWGDIGIPNSNCLFGFCDSRKQFWIGYGASGIRRWDPATGKIINPIPDGPDREAFANTIAYNMVEDEHGGYWLSTNRMGAVHIDGQGHILQRISLKDGLNNTAALYVWMQPGGNRLWIATSEGIQTYETSRKLLSAIDIDFGILAKDYCSVILGLGDKAYVSMNGKHAMLNLNGTQGPAATPRPLITNVRVFESERSVPPQDSALRLKHDENFFSIDFSSPLHHDAPALQYSYMLEGYDKDWVYCGRRQSAAYTNVPPGTYRFRVRTTNELGEWQQAESIMKIDVHAAFWQRGWFTALWVALLALVAWQLYRYINHRMRRQRIAATIDYFARSNYGDNSVDDICWDISRNCISQMGLDDCVVYLRDREKPVLVQVAAYGPKNPYGQVIENPIEIKIGEGIVGTAAAIAKPVLVNDTRKDPRYLVDDAARLSELAVPIIHDGEVIGVIDTEHAQKGYYKEAHLKALTTIASICANKIAEALAEASVRENERELLQIRSMLADSQLLALRTQMNPHFVFNSLNSIQECIVTGKYGEASHYLNKFSKLFRALLENSSKPLIPLAEEIAVLELYLSLEHMRFEGSFEYHIDVDDELDAEEIMIPSMLLQPFVENALWHGLMHKDGERRLSISFEAVGGELFRCTIDDNGIGRQKAAALKLERSGGKGHISRGLQITNDRIALMQRRGQAASIRIIDKHNSAGAATGTSVVLEMSAYLTPIQT